MIDIIIIIVIALIALGVVIAVLTNNENNKSKEIQNYLNKIQELGYNISNEENKPYDYLISNENTTFIVKLIKIPEYSEIQINNKVTWEVKYGAGNTVGKAQPYKKYLKEIEPFMNLVVDNSFTKLVIATPKPKKMVKYINECEIVFVTPKTDVYGVKLISLNDLTLFNENK
jgi:hypothetical protein